MRTNSLDVSSWSVLERLLTPTNALVVEVMLRTGLRVSDVLAVRTAQLKSRFTVSESKTGKCKRVYIGARLCDRLRAQAGTVYVFEHAKDPTKHRTRQAVWWDVKRAAKAMRIPLKIAPHSCRKSYAVDEYKKCADLQQVAKRLNHDRIETTVIYLLDMFGGQGGAPPFKIKAPL